MRLLEVSILYLSTAVIFTVAISAYLKDNENIKNYNGNNLIDKRSEKFLKYLEKRENISQDKLVKRKKIIERDIAKKDDNHQHTHYDHESSNKRDIDSISSDAKPMIDNAANFFIKVYDSVAETISSLINKADK
ncbi:hypothetical protein BB561_005248 [Smittium simulii]|uniref:Uncharacterized protein n=1 Tax=Smittium simulii TaxID=133385 RepID=A0A2T9YBB7_9FUNG|nr:hypothetical protein BB561_005248 [Smittium simulii]